MTIQENVPLAPLTTLQVGGPARYFAEAASEDDIHEAVDFARAKRLPLFVLGGGSNLLVADSGWPGLVLKIVTGGITQQEVGGAVIFEVGAGVDWDEFVGRAVAENCAGVECLSGIPGSVGGTPVQNVGAYGQEVSETIESVRAFDLKQGKTVVLPSEACGFRYRAGIFNLTGGINTFSVTQSWGYYDVDYFEFRPFTPPAILPVPASLSDPLVSQNTRMLMNYMTGIYGQKTLAGHQHDNSKNLPFPSSTYLNLSGGLKPAIRASDFITRGRCAGSDSGRGRNRRLPRVSGLSTSSAGSIRTRGIGRGTRSFPR